MTLWLKGFKSEMNKTKKTPQGFAFDEQQDLL